MGRLQNIDWYHYIPTYFVLKDLNSNPPMTGLRAWDELTRRDGDGGLLPAATREKLVSFALADIAHAKRPCSLMDLKTLNYLTDRLANRQLTPKEKTRFLDEAILFKLSVRTKVIAGDPVPYTVDHDALGPSNNSFWTKLSVDGAEVDGRRIDGNTGGYTGWEGPGSGTSGSSLEYRTPGKHRINFGFTIKVYSGPMDAVARGNLLYQSTRTLSGQFQVLADKPAGLIQAISDPKLAQAMQAAIVPESFHFNPHAGNFSGTIQLRSPPANVAFDVFVRYGGKEFPLGTVTCLAGATFFDSVFGTAPAPVPASVNLILRPSERAARMTVDEYSFWNQELTFNNVPVAQP
jgi:hypothetical protein